MIAQGSPRPRRTRSRHGRTHTATASWHATVLRCNGARTGRGGDGVVLGQGVQHGRRGAMKLRHPTRSPDLVVRCAFLARSHSCWSATALSNGQPPPWEWELKDLITAMLVRSGGGDRDFLAWGKTQETAARRRLPHARRMVRRRHGEGAGVTR